MALMKLSTYIQVIFAIIACGSTFSTVMGYSAEKELLSKMINVIDSHSNNDGKVLPGEMHSFHDTNYENYIKSKMQQAKDPKYDTNKDGKLQEEEILILQYDLVKEVYSRGVLDCLFIFRFDEDADQDLDKDEYAKLLADTSSVEEAMKQAKECHMKVMLRELFDEKDQLSMDKWFEQIESGREFDKNASDGDGEDDNVPGLCDILMEAIGSEKYYHKEHFQKFMQNTDCYKTSKSKDIFKMLDLNLDDIIDEEELAQAWDLYLHPTRSAKSHFGHRVNNFYNRFKHDSMDHIDMKKLLSADGSHIQLYDDYIQTPALDFLLGDLVPAPEEPVYEEPKPSDDDDEEEPQLDM